MANTLMEAVLCTLQIASKSTLEEDMEEMIKIQTCARLHMSNFFFTKIQLFSLMTEP